MTSTPWVPRASFRLWLRLGRRVRTFRMRPKMSRRMQILRTLLVFFAFCAASLEAAQAQATPTETRLSGQQVRQLVGVGAGPRNYAVVSWVAGKALSVPLDGATKTRRNPSRVMVAVRSRAGTSFRRPRPISPFNAELASIAVSETGKTMVVWANSDGKIRARYRTPRRGWSKNLRVAGIGATGFPDTPDVAIADDGTTVVGWRSNRRRNAGAQMVAMFHPRTGFRRPIQAGPKARANVPAPGGQGAFYAVSARNGGKGTAVWLSSCTGDPEYVRPGRSVNLSLRKGATRPIKIRGSNCPHTFVSLSENARGRAVVAINGHRFSSMVRVAVRPAGERRFRKAVRVSPKGMRASFSKVAVQADGSATLVAPITTGRGPAGIVSMKFVKPRPLDLDRDLIAAEWNAGEEMGANSRGDVAVLAQNTQTRRWVYTSKPAAGGFAPSIELPFRNFLDKPEMTIDRSAVAVAPSGKVLAATARRRWTERGGTSGFKGIYVFEGLPRPSK